MKERGQLPTGPSDINESAFWLTSWREDFRPSVRDVLRTLFFFACTALLEKGSKWLDVNDVAEWLRFCIHRVLDGLTLVTFAALSLTILIGVCQAFLGMYRATVKGERQR